MTCVNCDSDFIVVGWEVWYSDGTVKRGMKGWSALPKDGVTHVKLSYQGGASRVMSGADYYWRCEGENDAVYGFSQTVPEPSRYPGVVVLRGKWADDATFSYLQRAVNEGV